MDLKEKRLSSITYSWHLGCFNTNKQVTSSWAACEYFCTRISPVTSATPHSEHKQWSGEGITGKLKMWETNLPISLVPNPPTKGVNTVWHSLVKETWYFQSSCENLPFPAGSSARCTLQGNLKRRQNLALVQVHQQDGTDTQCQENRNLLLYLFWDCKWHLKIVITLCFSWMNLQMQA